MWGEQIQHFSHWPWLVSISLDSVDYNADTRVQPIIQVDRIWRRYCWKGRDYVSASPRRIISMG